MEIVVFHTAFIGDILLAIPFFRKLRGLEERCRITLVCRPGLKKFFLENKIVDDVIELEKGNASSELETLSRLKKISIRYLFCPHQSFRSAWMLRGVRAEKKIAYKRWWNFLFFNTRVVRPMAQPEPLRLLALLTPLTDIRLPDDFANSSQKNSVENWPSAISEDLSMAVTVKSDAAQELLKRLNIKKPFVVVAPSSQWPTKRWTTEGYAELCKRFARQNKNVYIVGSAAEVEDGEKICRAVKAIDSGSRCIVENLAGQLDLFDLHKFMSAADLVVANDSGSMHMAAAARAKVVAVFGPTVLAQGYRPWTNESVVVQKDLPCRPCGKHGHMKCPLGTHDCMKKITVDDVQSAISRL